MKNNNSPRNKKVGSIPAHLVVSEDTQTLSDKIERVVVRRIACPEFVMNILSKKDVKEFIKYILDDVEKGSEEDLKKKSFSPEMIFSFCNWFKDIVKKRAGANLI